MEVGRDSGAGAPVRDESDAGRVRARGHPARSAVSAPRCRRTCRPSSSTSCWTRVSRSSATGGRPPEARTAWSPSASAVTVCPSWSWRSRDSRRRSSSSAVESRRCRIPRAVSASRCSVTSRTTQSRVWCDRVAVAPVAGAAQHQRLAELLRRAGRGPVQKHPRSILPGRAARSRRSAAGSPSTPKSASGLPVRNSLGQLSKHGRGVVGLPDQAVRSR